MSRWKMNKLGFLNFWLYDQEEFPLHDGHILLRGNNGSGKSITTQSFIPFLLDGNKSPERLDPFGTRDRKMDFYLLGEGEREESTGYLYLEFKKDGVSEYLTIGIGMRAQRGKPIDFWGFCLNDGRRVGDPDFLLFEKIGGQMIPLSKRKLKSLLSSDENFVEAQEKYKSLVNDRLFRFRDIRQFDQLIQLLIKVRTPKLSKDAFRPSEVKKILNASLQVLTDEDLSAVVSTMERMDSLEDQLRDLRAAMKDAVIIRSEYTRYNQYILGKKGEAYCGARAKTLRLRKELRNAEEALAIKESELEANKRQMETAKHLLNKAMTQHSAIHDDDLSAKRVQLKEAQVQLRHFQEDLENGERTLKELDNRISNNEVDLRRKTQEFRDREAEMSAGLRELDEQNEILLLEEHVELACCLRTGSERFDYSVVRNALQRRKKKIDELMSCLTELDRANEEYDQACQKLDSADNDLISAKAMQRDAELKEQAERDSIIELMHKQQDENQEFLLSAEEMNELHRKLKKYRYPSDWTKVSALLDNRWRKLAGSLQDSRNRGELELQDLKRDRDELSQKLSRLKAMPDPVPPRREDIQATRVRLLMQGIPHAAFYETVDFSPELGQDERDLLEAQLMDAGLLDALVVPEEYRTRIQELLELYPDRFLVPEVTVDDPITCLIPDGHEQFHDIVTACLSGISRSNLESRTALLPDGRFRCGLVMGRSHAWDHAGFVGAAARKANRKRQISELTERLEGAEAAVREKQASVEALSGRLNILREEREQVPTAAALDSAIEELDQAREMCLAAEKKREECLQAETKARQIVSRIEQRSRELGRELPYQRSMEDCENARCAAGEYHELLGKLEIMQAKRRFCKDAASSVQEMLDDLYDRKSDQEQRNPQKLEKHGYFRDAHPGNTVVSGPAGKP